MIGYCFTPYRQYFSHIPLRLYVKSYQFWNFEFSLSALTSLLFFRNLVKRSLSAKGGCYSWHGTRPIWRTFDNHWASIYESIGTKHPWVDGVQDGQCSSPRGLNREILKMHWQKSSLSLISKFVPLLSQRGDMSKYWCLLYFIFTFFIQPKRCYLINGLLLSLIYFLG